MRASQRLSFSGTNFVQIFDMITKFSVPKTNGMMGSLFFNVFVCIRDDQSASIVRQCRTKKGGKNERM